jgi:hypothetical protein
VQEIQRPDDDDVEAISVLLTLSPLHSLIGKEKSAEADWALIIRGHYRGRSRTSFSTPRTLGLSLVSMGLRLGFGGRFLDGGDEDE